MRVWLDKVVFFKNYEESIFSLILFEISVMEKFFPSQIFQKVWVEKLILHSFWKIQFFPVIISWIIWKKVHFISFSNNQKYSNFINGHFYKNKFGRQKIPNLLKKKLHLEKKHFEICQKLLDSFRARILSSIFLSGRYSCILM